MQQLYAQDKDLGSLVRDYFLAEKAPSFPSSYLLELKYLEEEKPGLGRKIALYEAEKLGLLPEKGSPEYQLFEKDPLSYLEQFQEDDAPQEQREDSAIPIHVVYEILHELRNDARKRGYHVQ